MKNTLNLVLFDLDDTLFDHQHSQRYRLLALQKMVPSLAQIAIQDLIAEHERQLTMHYDSVLDGATSLRANRLERFREIFVRFGVEMNPLEIEEAVHCYRRAYVQNRQAVPGAIPLLTFLKSRLQIGVVTNGLTGIQQEKLRACGIENYIDFLLTSEAAGMKKPNPRIFIQALDMAQANRDDTIFIGDSWTSDIVGAHQAGIQSIWLNRTQKPCPDPSLTEELSAFEPLTHVLEALYSG